MAPSAIEQIQVPILGTKVGVVAATGTSDAIDQDTIVHVHGGEGKTPLEAISHGDLVLPGE